MNHGTNKKKNKDQQQFEFCEVCKLNHNQGRRHNFFPSHKNSLSAVLKRFQSKLSDVKLFLKTPMRIHPDHAQQNRLWCVFCSCDILEHDNQFACGNAIEHLASEEHWKRVKGFMWKYGGGMDLVDTFRIAEVDHAKWEKKCKSLTTEATKAESAGLLNRMREFQFPVQYYLLSQRLVHLLGEYKEMPNAGRTQQITRIISIPQILFVMDLPTQEQE